MIRLVCSLFWLLLTSCIYYVDSAELEEQRKLDSKYDSLPRIKYEFRERDNGTFLAIRTQKIYDNRCPLHRQESEIAAKDLVNFTADKLKTPDSWYHSDSTKYWQTQVAVIDKNGKDVSERSFRRRGLFERDLIDALVVDPQYRMISISVVIGVLFVIVYTGRFFWAKLRSMFLN